MTSTPLPEQGGFNELMPQITELYIEWCRLNGISLGKAPIEIAIDKATGVEAARMREFISWFYLEVLGRLPKEDTHGTK